MIIIRDDDISVHTCPHSFKEVHQFFIDHKIIHTVACLMKDLWENQAVFHYLITAPYLNIELHGLTHKNYSLMTYDEAFAELRGAMDYYNINAKRMLNTLVELPELKRLTTFFSPWNKDSETIRKVCADLGLRFNNTWDEFSFHCWSDEETKKVKENILNAIGTSRMVQ